MGNRAVITIKRKKTDQKKIGSRYIFIGTEGEIQ